MDVKSIQWTGFAKTLHWVLWVNGKGVGLLRPSDTNKGKWFFKHFDTGKERETSFSYTNSADAIGETLTYLDLEDDDPWLEWTDGYSFSSMVLWVDGKGIGVIRPKESLEQGACKWVFHSFSGTKRETTRQYDLGPDAIVEIEEFLGMRKVI